MPINDDGKIITDPTVTPFHPHGIDKFHLYITKTYIKPNQSNITYTLKAWQGHVRVPSMQFYITLHRFWHLNYS